MTKTFSEILDEQLVQNTSENSGESLDSHYSSHVEYAHFYQIRFTDSPIFTPSPPANSRSKYLSQVRVVKVNSSVERPVEYILESHQKTSLDYLNERLAPSPRLIGQFSFLQLKTAFRRLAKDSHPDHGGHAESFLELMNHFKVLSNFLTSLN